MLALAQTYARVYSNVCSPWPQTKELPGLWLLLFVKAGLAKTAGARCQAKTTRQSYWHELRDHQKYSKKKGMKTGTHTQVPVPMTIACPHDYSGAFRNSARQNRLGFLLNIANEADSVA